MEGRLARLVGHFDLRLVGYQRVNPGKKIICMTKKYFYDGICLDIFSNSRIIHRAVLLRWGKYESFAFIRFGSKLSLSIDNISFHHGYVGYSF